MTEQATQNKVNCFITGRDVFAIECMIRHRGSNSKSNHTNTTQIIVAENFEEAVEAVRNGFPHSWWSEQPDCKDELVISSGKMVVSLNLEATVETE